MAFSAKNQRKSVKRPLTPHFSNSMEFNNTFSSPIDEKTHSSSTFSSTFTNKMVSGAIEHLNIAHMYQITKNSVELTWYAVLAHHSEFLTSYEVQVFSDTSPSPVGHVLSTFIDVRRSLARTIQIPIQKVERRAPAAELRGRVRVKGGSTKWSEWSSYKVTEWKDSGHARLAEDYDNSI